jgi:hypothetical protein
MKFMHLTQVVQHVLRKPHSLSRWRLASCYNLLAQPTGTMVITLTYTDDVYQMIKICAHYALYKEVTLAVSHSCPSSYVPFCLSCSCAFYIHHPRLRVFVHSYATT